MEEEVKLSVVDEEEVDTVLGSEIEFEGDVESSKSLMIKGKSAAAYAAVPNSI